MQHEDSDLDGGAAILYAAKSTKDERGSNKTQLADGRAFAECNGLTVEGEYADEDASAYHGNRGPELEAALDHAERIGACIVVQHSDRLARGDGVHARHLVQLVLDAKARGVRLRSKEDDSSLENVVMAAVMGERNTEDSRRKGAAVRAGMERKRQRGEYIGHRPYGYRWERNADDIRVIVPDPAEAAIIRRIFAEYLAGRSQKAISRDLSRDKVPSHRGGQWHPGTVRLILARPLYAGWIPDGADGVLEGKHEPIIDREDWEKVAELRKAKARTHGRGRPVAGRHIFRKGFLRCGICGESMIPRTTPNRASPPRETYECYGHWRDVETCSMMPVQRADIDSAVLAYFEQVGLDLNATRDQLRSALNQKLDEARALLAAAERDAASAAQRLARVKRDYTNGDLTAPEWRGLRAELEPEATAAEAEVERLRKAVAAHQADTALDEAEAEVAALLDSIRSTVTGNVKDNAGIQAVSATLLRLFDHFTYHIGIPADANVELIDTDSWIEPAIASRAVEGYDNEMRPILPREPLGQAPNNYVEGFGS